MTVSNAEDGVDDDATVGTRMPVVGAKEAITVGVLDLVTDGDTEAALVGPRLTSGLGGDDTTSVGVTDPNAEDGVDDDANHSAPTVSYVEWLRSMDIAFKSLGWGEIITAYGVTAAGMKVWQDTILTDSRNPLLSATLTSIQPSLSYFERNWPTH